MIIMIIIGLIREVLGTLPRYHWPLPGQCHRRTRRTSGLIAFA